MPIYETRITFNRTLTIEQKTFLIQRMFFFVAVDEVKVKWKGIRSSFNRYKAKLHQNNNEGGFFKKYYLYDHLRFLEPFVRPKG